MKSNFNYESFEKENPIAYSKLNNQKIGVTSGFYNNDPMRAGIALAKWKAIALVAIPFSCYFTFKVLTYADLIKLEEMNQKANVSEISEKKVLES